MTDTKKCPSCNEDVPILAVRCKACGARLSAPIEALFGGPDLTPPDEPSMIANLDDLEDLDADVDLNGKAGVPPVRMSAPPPPPRSSVSPGTKTSAPPPPPSGPAGRKRPVTSAPPPPPNVGGAAKISVMPPADAPEELPPEAVPASLTQKSASSALLGTEGSLLHEDEIGALDLDDDILDDDLEEISKFTEQTAITDVSTLAQGMADDEVDDDLPADLLEDILDDPGADVPQAIADAPKQASIPAPSISDPMPPGFGGPGMDSEFGAGVPTGVDGGASVQGGLSYEAFADDTAPVKKG